MGARGPVGKRAEERLGHRTEAEKARTTRSAGAESVRRPPADRRWHPVARSWYEALGKSGQSSFYEPSDWQMAKLVAELISRDLGEKVVGVTKDGDVVRAVTTISAASLSAYLRAFDQLLVSEGSRRRVNLELQRHPKGPLPDNVSDLSEYRDL